MFKNKLWNWVLLLAVLILGFVIGRLSPAMPGDQVVEIDDSALVAAAGKAITPPNQRTKSEQAGYIASKNAALDEVQQTCNKNSCSGFVVTYTPDGRLGSVKYEYRDSDRDGIPDFRDPEPFKRDNFWFGFGGFGL